jgi:glutathione-S-conjugate glycine hydrolase
VPTAKYAPWVTLLSEDPTYLRQAPAPAYWALAPHYVGQITDCACSLASAAMLVNVARRRVAQDSGSKLVSQAMLLEAVDDAPWRDGVAADGGNGASLRQLAALIERGLAAFGLEGGSVAAVPLAGSGADGLARFRAALAEGEAATGRFFIANYYMAAAIGEGDYGHFSPLGAYDATSDRVLVLDVYRVEYEPYWLPLERLFAAMAIANRSDGEPRGYLDIRLADTGAGPHPSTRSG